MKSFKRGSIIMVVLSIFVAMSFISSVAGTLAWYAYSTRVVISFTGTAVRQSVQLRIGIVDDSNYYSSDEISLYNMERVNESDGHSVVWTPGANGLTSEMINDYLENSPYATNELSPVSTFSRANDDDPLTLYASPECSDECGIDHVKEVAEEQNYVQIPFAFKVLNSLGNPLGEKEIWLTASDVGSSLGIEDAIRVFVNDDTNVGRRYIYHPHYSGADTEGTTVMAGQLDLNNDGYYDYQPSTGYEYIYGDIEVENDDPIAYGAPRAESSLFIDENDTGDTSQDVEDKTTFYARHFEGTRSPNFSTPEITKLTAKHYTRNAVFPTLNGSGDFVGGMPVTITDATDKIGYATLTIYLEGWDHSVIDQVVGDFFYLGLQFEINKV